ncbi:MBL fold metallo-hydrolase [Paludibacterium purpuratum]|uniref:Glyoxylase-like metal-dependent hydrolase (Beta-lactamase superfamily II) n=1 Tax=Paludibacterium purpuratum TaxID=1144873 RepID=A0A4R7B3G9_9NEIS|nr:MBL fold metallo-hydrolase [Paludibacterium purpuratum]TDR76525.1 glyoxylase-like metal-dependent hydrolase (beta-lactamase superfamily II) [Paludibacterium purpuratum]
MALHYHVIPVTPFAQNCSILWCDETQRAAVVDAGGDLKRILDFVQTNGLKIEKLLLTHGHIDHAGGAAELADQLGVEIEGPQAEDAFWLDQLPQQSQAFGFPASTALTPQRWLNDGDTVSVGKQTLRVIHCPGHTPGHVVFYSSDAGLLVAGDVLFQGSIGRTDFPRGNHRDLLDAIHSKLFILPDDTTVITGHGPFTTLGDEKRSNPFVMNAGYR